jgi:hypothetical protein
VPAIEGVEVVAGGKRLDQVAHADLIRMRRAKCQRDPGQQEQRMTRLTRRRALPPARSVCAPLMSVAPLDTQP